MARNHRPRLEEALDGQRRRLRPHGEAVADRDHDHFRRVQLVDQRHVAENVRVAHMIDRGLARRLDDDSVRKPSGTPTPASIIAAEWSARTSVTENPPWSVVPPVFIGSKFCKPFEASHMHSRSW